jgi:hypothetical protein
VAAVQDFINRQQKFNYRLLVQRVSIDVIGPETAPNPEIVVAGEEAVIPPPPPPPPPPLPQSDSVQASQAAPSPSPSLSDN